MRVVFDLGSGDREALRAAFAEVAGAMGMTWTLRDRAMRKRVMILASQTDHCLSDLIWRWRRRELPMDLAAVVSNHPAASFPHTDLKGVAFHHLPVTPDSREAQEAALWSLIEEPGTELVDRKSVG